MAKISKKPNRKGTPPKLEEASTNLTNAPKIQTGIRKDLNFKVDADFKKEFKQYAMDKDMTMHDLLIKMFEYYKTSHS